MLETLLGILTSGGAGAIVGLIGSLATKWLEFKTLDKKLQFETEMARIRTQELELEQAHAIALADKQMQIAEVEGRIAADVAAMGAFTESQKEARVQYGGWVDQVRGLMRPVITLFLLTVTTAFAGMLWHRVGGFNALDGYQLVDLFDYLVRSAVFLTITAVSWWFGSRPTEWSRGGAR